MKIRNLIMAGAFMLGLSTIASAQPLSLQDGDASFTITVPTSDNLALSQKNATFIPDGTQPQPIDHMWQNWWFWRINGSTTREFAIRTDGPAAVVGNGTSSGVLSWFNLASGNFNASLAITLAEGPSTGQALVTQTLTITNNTQNSLNMSLFNYADFDIGGLDNDENTNDEATMLPDNVMFIFDESNFFAQYQGVDADAFQITPWADIAAALGDTSVGDLDNTGDDPFGPDDFTGGFQWNRVIGAGESATFTAIFAFNQNVPAPAALALLGIAGLAGRRRRRIA